jgi:hypothetical protein
MTSQQQDAPYMLWPSSVGQDAFVDLSSRSLSIDNGRLDVSGELKDKPSKQEKEKDRNNKGPATNEKEKENVGKEHDGGDSSKPKETDLSMKERIKMKTGVFRKHLTEYLKEMGSSANYGFDTEDNSKCIVWDDKGRIKHATLLKIVEKLTSEKHTGRVVIR